MIIRLFFHYSVEYFLVAYVFFINDDSAIYPVKIAQDVDKSVSMKS